MNPPFHHLRVGFPEFWNGCFFSVNRLKKDPVDYEAIITKGLKYTDTSFERSEQYMALPHSGIAEWFDYWTFGWLLYDWRRLGEVYPDATLFGESPEFVDV